MPLRNVNWRRRIGKWITAVHVLNTNVRSTWSASQSSRFIVGEMALDTRWTGGCVYPVATLNPLEEWRKLFPCLEWNADYSVVPPVASPLQLTATQAACIVASGKKRVHMWHITNTNCNSAVISCYAVLYHGWNINTETPSTGVVPVCNPSLPGH